MGTGYPTTLWGGRRRSGAGVAAARPASLAGNRLLRQGGETPLHLARRGAVAAQALNSVDELSTRELEDGLSETGSPLVVAYQGVPGAYSEGAALKACPGWEPLPCEQFETAFQALSQWMAERAVLPIENSLGGSIHAVYDLLLRYRLHIVGEVTVEVNHCLMALPGTQIDDLEVCMSHPQALAQW